jgi:tetratricopeptide (TPR) repeat protein
MMQQTEALAGTAPDAPGLSPKLALSDEVRASLQAVRTAQLAAHVRARRQTVRARIWFAGMLAAAAVAAVAAGPRVARWRHPRTQAPLPAQASVRAPQPAAPATALPQPPAPVATEAPAPVATEAPAAVAPPVTAHEVAPPDKACDATAVRSAPWRLSPDACARAFEADPGNATLALAVAHAALVRGRFAEAADWARRTLALDPKAAEAYVIIARAEAANGRQDDARTAYAHYLELAPRGWHKAEARAAVHPARAASEPGTAGAR